MSLSTAYAVADVLRFSHSLHRNVTSAPAFYLIYGGLIAVAAVLVVLPGVPLGLLTSAVQTLAGVLLPSATVFLLLLSNDRDVLGPWANTRRTNIFTSVVIAVLVMLSVVLTVSVLFPGITARQIVAILVAGAVLAIACGIWIASSKDGRLHAARTGHARARRDVWRMPALEDLPPARLTTLNRVWLIALRAYLVLAVGLLVVRVVQHRRARACAIGRRCGMRRRCGNALRARA